MPKERFRKMKKTFFCCKQISKCDTSFYIHFLRGLFQNIGFRSVAIVPKKLWTILDKKTGLKNFKKFFKLLFLKVTKFHDDSVKNEC